MLMAAPVLYYYQKTTTVFIKQVLTTPVFHLKSVSCER